MHVQHGAEKSLRSFAAGKACFLPLSGAMRIVNLLAATAPHRNLLGATEQAPKIQKRAFKLRGISQSGYEDAAHS